MMASNQLRLLQGSASALRSCITEMFCLFLSVSILHNLHVCRYIDGRVWPEQDELEVRLMMDLIKHVTGK